MNPTANYCTWSWGIHRALFIQSTHLLISIGFRTDGILCALEQSQERLSPVVNPLNIHKTRTKRITASLQDIINLIFISRLRRLSLGSESHSGLAWEITPSLSPKKVCCKIPRVVFI